MSSAQIKNLFEGVGEIEASLSPSALQLKLTVTRHAVNYFVVTTTHHQVVFWGSYTLHHIDSAEALAERFEKIYEKDEILQLPFAEVLLGIDEEYVLAPAQLASIFKSAQQRSQSLQGVEIIFNCPQVLQNTLQRLFPKGQLLHLNSTFIRLPEDQHGEMGNKLFVNVAKEHLDVMWFEGNGTLQLMNRYAYKVATDFIYFVLMCSNELKINREETELVLMGDIDENSVIYNYCYRYFRNISFVKSPAAIQFSNAFQSFPRHRCYNLYNLNA